MIILDTAAALFSDDYVIISADDILSASRAPRIVQARAAAAYALREAGLTLEEVGQILHRDHTTIIYHVRTAESRARTDAAYAARLRALVSSATARKKPLRRPSRSADDPIFFGVRVVSAA